MPQEKLLTNPVKSSALHILPVRKWIVSQ